MLVENLMTEEVESCRPESSLAEAAAVMWRRDCGIVPVVDEAGRAVGVITDRDICMALATRRQYASEVRVGEVISGNLFTCTPADDVEEALETMRRRQVRRLPVTNSEGVLVGILSLSDVARRTRKGGSRKKRVSRKQTLATLKTISSPHGAADEAPEDGAAEADAGEEAGGESGVADGEGVESSPARAGSAPAGE